MRVLLLLALAAPAVALRARADGLGSVVKTLQGLVADNQKLAEDQRTTYAKLKCWCDHTKDDLTENLAKNRNVREETDAAIAEDRAKNGESSQLAYDLENEINALNDQLKDETTKQENRHQEYEDRKKEVEGFVEQLGNAIPKLAAIGADQTDGSSGAEHESRMAGFEGLQLKVKDALTRHLSLMQVLAPHTWESKSSQIIGMLQEMKDNFERELKDTAEIDQKMTAIYDEYKAGVEAAVDKKTKARAAQMKLIGEAVSRLDTALATNAKSIEYIEADTLSFADMNATCAAKKQEYELFVADNKRLIEGMEKAIQILNSDEAFKAMKGLKNDKWAGFLQLASPRSVVAKKLHLLSLVSSNFKIAKVAVLLRQGKAFAEVCKVLDDVIATIEKDETTEAAEKEQCTTLRKEKTDEKNAAEAKKASLEGDIMANDNAISDFKDRIEGLETDISNLQDDRRKLLEQQKAEMEAWNELDTNSKTSRDLLQKAIAVMRDYENRAEKSATDLMQQPVASAAVTIDKTKGDKAFNVDQLQSAYGGVIKTLEGIHANVKQEHEDAEKTHNQAVADFDRDLNDNREQTKEKQEDLGQQNDLLAKEEEAKAENEKQLAATVDNIEAITLVLKDNEPNCKWLEDNYGKRKAAREKEIAGLHGAKGDLKC